MSQELTLLLEQLKGGDRDAGGVLWEQSRKQLALAPFVFATRALHFQDRLIEALTAAWKRASKKADEQCVFLGQAIGLDLSEAHRDLIDQALKQANSTRIQARLHLQDVLSLWRELREQKGCHFTCSPVSPTGATMMLAACTDDALHIYITKVMTDSPRHTDNTVVPNWRRGTQLSPGMLDQHFVGWEALDASAQKERFLSWPGRNIGTMLAIPALPLPSPVDEAEAITSVSTYLPPQQNERLSASLAIIEQVDLQDPTQMSDAWQKLLDEWHQWPDVMDDIELSILDRALESWPDQQREYLIDGMPTNPRPFQRLCRTFCIDEDPENGPRPTIPYVLFEGDFLASARHLSVRGGPTLFEAVFANARGDRDDRSLHALHSLELVLYEACPASVSGWLAECSIWSQIESLAFCESLDQEEQHRPDHELLLFLLPQLTQLTKLVLTFGELGAEVAKALNAHSTLSQLHFVSLTITTQAASVWEESLPLSLRTVIWEHVEIPKLRFFGAAAPEGQITSLTMDTYNGVPGTKGGLLEGLFAAPAYARLSTYQVKVHYGFRWQRLGLSFLEEKGILSHLEQLSVEMYQLEQDDLDVLKEGERLPVLTSLRLSLGIDADGRRIFSESQDPFLELMDGTLPKSLQVLDLDVEVEEKSFKKLFRQKLPHLEELKLPRVARFSTELGKQLAKWRGLSQLKRLTFRCQGTFYKQARKVIESSPHFPEGLQVDWGH